MSLSEQEKKELSRLLGNIDSTDIRGEVWHQLVTKFITVPIELCILDKNNRVFLVYRKDKEYDGYHMPGTVINDWETVETACKRLVEGEVMRDAGLTISYPEPIGWVEVTRNLSSATYHPRHGIALLHIAHLKGGISSEGSHGFYDFGNLPENILECHKYLLGFYRRYLENGKVILGK
jgi:ADP-ribose pyrophosphatase YjhB (NUDIX family)